MSRNDECEKCFNDGKIEGIKLLASAVFEWCEKHDALWMTESIVMDIAEDLIGEDNAEHN